MKEYKIHEYARLFPAMSDEELEELANDIRENGLQNPVWIDEHDCILDGRNRAAACRLAGVEVEAKLYFGNEEEKLRFVVSQNVHRRHLNTSQRAVIAATMAESFEALAKARQSAVLKRGSEAAPVKEKFPEREGGQSRDQAGAALNVSGKTVDMAKKVIAKAAPEIVEAVTKGDLAVSRAAKIADLPKEQQVAALEAAPTTRTKRERLDLWLCLVDDDPMEIKEVAVNKLDPTNPLTGCFVFSTQGDALAEGEKHYDPESVRAVTVAEFLKEAAGL
jgi:hypothetical protein